MSDLTGKTTIVVGASRGLGRGLPRPSALEAYLEDWGSC